MVKKMDKLGLVIGGYASGATLVGLVVAIGSMPTWVIGLMLFLTATNGIYFIKKVFDLKEESE